MIRVTIVYPADPMGVIPGGIDTCIRDIIRLAPDDFHYSLLGATTDPVSRPVRKWTTCDLGNKEFDFFPLYLIDNPEKQPKIPATVRHLLPLLLNKPGKNFDILQFHRIEQILPYLGDEAPKFTFIHQNMAVVESRQSDIRWKYAPSLYFKMENWLLPKFEGVFCVHREGVDRYKSRYIDIGNRFRFIPTWMNPDIFFPAEDAEKRRIKDEFQSRYGISPEVRVLLSVGRIDKQKNPHRLLNALSRLIEKGEKVHLLMIGDGVLRKEVENLVFQQALSEHLTITGIIPNEQVARYLRGSDILVLASDYEGMPRCVIEALGCGVPVATTDVGEVRKVVIPGVNGQISNEFGPEELSDALMDCLNNIEKYSGKPCIDAVEAYTPAAVLQPVYDAYRRALGVA